jgi:beta-glucosidase
MERTAFPADFVWGSATSAYQIEGHPLADGAAPSIWHELAHRKGKIQDGTTGDLACDHYRRYREDVAIMRDLGLKGYRFSIAWPRVFPEPGRLNPKGIDFYARLVDALLEAGIEPFATLFHWDTPVWLERMGGFARRVSVDHAAEFGAAVFRALGDRLKSWITVNEPLVYTFLGYIQWNHAPGHRLDLRGGYHASHHLLLAHARLRELCRAEVTGGRIGIANHNVWISPRDPGRPRDVEAAALMDDAANRLYLDALFRGRYPERVVRRLGRFLPRGFERDLEEIHGREDFVGVNYYARQAYRWSWITPIVHAWEWQDPRAPRSTMWEIYPEGLYLTLRRLQTEYGNPPCFVTENGYPLPERPGADPLDDTERIGYLADHVAMMGRAIGEGADCRGYFHWSLMDNFEWDLGTTMRFGLLRTDFATMARSWRKSAHWYRDLVQANRLERGRTPHA